MFSRVLLKGTSIVIKIEGFSSLDWLDRVEKEMNSTSIAKAKRPYVLKLGPVRTFQRVVNS